MRNREYMSLRDAIDQFLSQHGLKDKAKTQQVIVNWEQIMGKPLAEQTEKIWYQQHILYLKIPSPVWRQELNSAKREIIKIVNQQIGEDLVKEVKIFP